MAERTTLNGKARRHGPTGAASDNQAVSKRQSGRGQRGRDGWWSVRVELLGGGASGELWPTPGRIFALSPQHTFQVFAEAIDDAFARWDRSHLHEFAIPRLGKTVTEFRFSGGEEDPDQELDADVVTLGDVLQLGEEFTYTFELGDKWRHRCLLADTVIDPDEVLGVVPDRPLPYWGWGVIPDPYGRLWDGDDGETRCRHRRTNRGPGRTRRRPPSPQRTTRASTPSPERSAAEPSTIASPGSPRRKRTQIASWIEHAPVAPTAW